MSSLAMGLALEEYKPIVYYERHDFMMVAMDSLVNHISQIERISHQEFKTSRRRVRELYKGACELTCRRPSNFNRGGG